MPVPADFPLAGHTRVSEVFSRLDAAYRAANKGRASDEWMASINAWKGVAYRWRALDLADADFRKYVQDGRHSFFMEAALFSFFTCAVSAIEISCFCFYGLIAQLQPATYDLIARNPRAVTPNQALASYKSGFAAEPITAALDRALASAAYRDLAAIRHELSHRGTQTPGIVVFATFHTGPLAADAEEEPKAAQGWSTWRNIRLDEKLTVPYREQCVAFLTDMWTAAAEFGEKHVPV